MRERKRTIRRGESKPEKEGGETPINAQPHVKGRSTELRESARYPLERREGCGAATRGRESLKRKFVSDSEKKGGTRISEGRGISITGSGTRSSGA